MADPSTWKPGNPGDLQPWRALRKSSEFPAPRLCGRYTEWIGSGDPRPAANTSPSGYGYPRDTCIMCGRPADWHESEWTA